MLLGMVRNEERVVGRMLDAVKGQVDAAVVADTGSTDGTVAAVQGWLAANDTPGAVVQHEWRNFGHNRTASFAALVEWVKKNQPSWRLDRTWALALDADQVLRGRADDAARWLAADRPTALGGYLEQRAGDTRWSNVRLMRLDGGWRAVGATHEFWQAADGTGGSLPLCTQAWIDDRGDGGCKADKFERDAVLLAEALVKDPLDPRSLYYLGDSLRSLGRHAEALECYQRHDAVAFHASASLAPWTPLHFARGAGSSASSRLNPSPAEARSARIGTTSAPAVWVDQVYVGRISAAKCCLKLAADADDRAAKAAAAGAAVSSAAAADEAIGFEARAMQWLHGAIDLLPRRAEAPLELARHLRLQPASQWRALCVAADAMRAATGIDFFTSNEPRRAGRDPAPWCKGAGEASKGGGLVTLDGSGKGDGCSGLLVDTGAADWKLAEEASIAAWWADQRHAGLRAVDHILCRADRVPPASRSAAAALLKFYLDEPRWARKVHLAMLLPRAERVAMFGEAEADAWKPCNPSIRALPDGGGFELVLRYFNSETPDAMNWKQRAGPPNTFCTRNVLARVDADFKLVAGSAREIVPTTPVAPGQERCNVMGVEDLRLVGDSADPVGIACHRQWHGGRAPLMAWVRWDADGSAGTGAAGAAANARAPSGKLPAEVFPLSSPTGAECEKNWTATADARFLAAVRRRAGLPPKDHASGERDAVAIVHTWWPMRVLDGKGTVVWEEPRPAAGQVFGVKGDRWRGSAPPVPWTPRTATNGPGWLALVHEVGVESDGKRTYAHRVVEYDDQLRLRRVSLPWMADARKAVNYVAGAAWDGDHLVVTYGVQDSDAWAAWLHKDEVAAMLEAGHQCDAC